jgi:transposase-like protein
MCGNNEQVIRSGYNRGGSQRLRCQSCNHYFTPHRGAQGYDQSMRETAVRLYLEGTSFRGIGKVLRVSHSSVINWVNAHARSEVPQQIEEVVDTSPSEVVEVDELFTFIGEKKSKRTS